MASITFSPSGSQLDNDEIADIQIDEGDRFDIDFILDTSGLPANLQSFKLQADQDFAEVDLVAARTDFDSATFPEFNLTSPIENDNFDSVVFERNGEVGATPDTINVIVEGEITALEGLTNDGQPDFGVTLTEAIDVNGQDVTHLFEPTKGAIDLQPDELPQVGVEIEPSFVVEGGEPQTFTFNFSEPVPAGGLVLDVLITNPDGGGDTAPNLEEAVNITDTNLRRDEQDRPIAEFTIAEGATEASVDFAAFEDDMVEGNESFALTLLPTDSYTVDPDNSTADSIIADANTAIDGTESADVLDGTDNADAILGGEGNDIISGEDNNDALSGGNGSDRLFGDAGDDSVFGDAGDDRLFGGDGLDTLKGGLGQDTLIGGTGSDLLAGGENEDRLIGVELNGSQPGLNEQDTLAGGVGADTFILGNEAGIFYDDGDNSAFGDADFAAIDDFNIQEDKIELFGSAEQYSLDFVSDSEGNTDAQLVYNSGLGSQGELVALLEDVSPELAVDDAAFTFV